VNKCGVYEISYNAAVSIAIRCFVDAALTFARRRNGKVPTNLGGNVSRIVPFRPDNAQAAPPLAFLNGAREKNVARFTPNACPSSPPCGVARR
jgi:hypothetical protein